MRRTKKESPEKLREKDEAKKKSDIKDALTQAKFAGKPTYYFPVGATVVHGAWPETTVLEVIEDGLVYVVRDVDMTQKKPDIREQVVAWISLRPKMPGSTSFSSNEDIRLSYSNLTIESLIYRHIFAGVDFEPDYQRERVWTQEDKESLLDSIFMGADIGRFVFRQRTDEEWHKDGLSYEIVDGKQRLLTLLDFYENRLEYRGVMYNELSGRDRRRFLDANTALAELRNADREMVLRVFLMLHRGGRPVSEKVIEKAEHLLAECIASKKN